MTHDNIRFDLACLWIEPEMLTIEKLSSRHDRSRFDCGDDELNAYVKHYAGQHERKRVGRTYVAVEEGHLRVLGFYTISSGAVAFDTVPENLPHHPIPVALIGRLAVDKDAQGRGLGETLLLHALQAAQQVLEIMGIYAVVVDALNQQAENLYMKHGFNELSDDRLHLYLPIKTINQLKL